MDSSWGINFHLCKLNFLLDDKIKDLSKLKAFADKINVINIEICVWKTLWEKEESLVIAIFSFSNNDF